MPNSSSLDLFYDSLFEPNKKASLTPSQQKQMERYHSAFIFWMDKPWIKESKLCDFLVTNYEISKVQAYRDIKNLKLLYGRVSDVSKEWYRHLANELITEAVSDLESAKKGIDISIAEAKIKAAKVLVSVNKLNKDDAEPQPWDEIIPQPFEPVTDPSVIGLKPIPRGELKKRIAELEKRYGQEIEIEDIPYEPLED